MTLTFDPEIDPQHLAGARVTIVGLGKGRTTAGLARYLVERGARVTITDPKGRADLAEGIGRLGDVPVELVLAPAGDDVALNEPDLVFFIPGQRPRSATVQRAVTRGIPVATEIGLFFRLCPAPIIGVTGTKGKSTTTTLISRILSRGARKVILGGNIGNAVIQDLPLITAEDLVLLELSSFQLETLGRSPHIAVVTNILEDHLDHHGTRDAYVAAKRNIVAWQTADDLAVLNLDDPVAATLQAGLLSAIRGVSLLRRPERGAWLAGDQLTLVDGGRTDPLCAVTELRVPGRHNIQNALAAAIVGDLCGIAPDAIAAELRAFTGLPHRLETVGEDGGVLWVNDSQGTTPYATIPALRAYGRPPVVILGGVSKAADFSALGREVVARARGAVLIGQAGDDIAGAIERAREPGTTHPPVVRAASLEEAVAAARALARPGDVVILSPACASFDMFASYEDRGDRFKRLVEAFASPAGAMAE
ncbi:MAG: UDP-N-acetylmuramoyl-L-alanine--D-glutamate ligase [Candidatus Limnocylindrales bacterium]